MIKIILITLILILLYIIIKNNNNIELFQNNIKYYLDKNINFSNIDKKIIKKLSYKINIKIIDITKINNNKYNKIYVLNNPNKYQKKFICISSLLKDITSKMKDIDKLYFLKNIFKNENIIIFCPGPSYNSLTNNEKKYLINNYITISVKYTINDFKKLNLNPTFCIINEWSLNYNFNYENIFLINGYSKKKNINADLNFKLNSKNNHNHSFNLLKKNKNIIEWNLYEFNKINKIYYYPMHIMCELVFPLCILLGIKNIYTVGWDLNYSKNNSYFNKNIKNSIINNTNIPSEIIILKNIEYILKKKNISIYKIKKESPLNIKYKYIF